MKIPKTVPNIDAVKARLHYDPESGKFYHTKNRRYSLIGKQAGWKTPLGYMCISINSRNYMAHRIAWLFVTGEWPVVVDHINGNRSDNRICNLRSATISQNYANTGKRRHNTSGFKGVTKATKGKKWRAQISYGGRTRSLGLFETPELAHAAYMKKAKEVFGEFARAA